MYFKQDFSTIIGFKISKISDYCVRIIKTDKI